MSQTIFLILIPTITLIISFTTSNGQGLINSQKKWNKFVTPKGWLVVFLNFAIIGLVLWQNTLTSDASKKDKDDLLRQRKESDSTITAGVKSGVDSSRRVLFEDLSIALAKQNLQLDTLTKSLTIIKDSTRNIVNNYSQDDPVLIIDTGGIKLINGKEGMIYISSKDAGSTNFNLKSFIFNLNYQNKVFYIDSMHLLSRSIKIPKNNKWEVNFNLDCKEPLKGLFVYTKGTYTTLDGTKKYRLDNLYFFDLKDNITSLIIANAIKDSVIKTIPKRYL
jgi:hypothetical protein